jgi:hypothetical protein
VPPTGTGATGAAAPIGHAPVATDDAAGTTTDTPVLIDVLANDVSPAGEPLTVVAFASVTSEGLGILTFDNNRLRFAPTGTTGTATFSYTIADTGGGRSTANVTVTIVAPASP